MNPAAIIPKAGAELVPAQPALTANNFDLLRFMFAFMVFLVHAHVLSGRGELAPSSDLDLLFLRAYKPTAFTESVTEYMLYMLWDMGLKVGHSSRNIDESLKLAREDHTIQTALLEARGRRTP